MPRRHAPLAALLATALALGCAGPAPTGTNPAPTRPRGSVAPGKPSPPDATSLTSPAPPGASPTTPATGASPAGVPSPTLADPLATLVGRVKAPAGVLANYGAGLISDKGGSIVSNNGGSVVSNNGGGVVSNNGGGYRVQQVGYRLRQATAALEQFYVPDAEVELVDATGQVATGPDGQPMRTRTGPDGTYRFTQALPAKALVVRVTPPGATGALTRLLARDVKAADVDLSSALVASYVLERYVASQPDRQATLEKLPADVEATTVQRASDALGGGALAAGGLPTALTSAALLASAEGLRRADAGFDTQMEVVRKILIAAGVSNLGAGMPATELFFRRFTTVHALPDGGFAFHGVYDNLIWRIGKDGLVDHVAGSGNPGTNADVASRAGLVARDLPLTRISALHQDDQGRMLALELDHGVWRIERDGAITELTPWAAFKGTYLEHSSDPVNLLADGTVAWAAMGKVWTVPPGGAAKAVAEAPGLRPTRAVPLSGGRWLVGDHRGMAICQPGQAPVPQWARTDIPDHIRGDGYLTVRQPWVDEAGNVFYEDEAKGELHLVRPDGEDRLIAPTSALKRHMTRGWVGADGRVWVADATPQDGVSPQLVWCFDADMKGQTLVAGRAGFAAGFLPGGVLPLLRPEDMDVAPDGTLWLADGGAILKVRPGQAPEVVLARDTSLAPANEPLAFTGVRVTTAGKLVVRALGATRELILRQTDAGWDLPVAIDEEWVNLQTLVTMAWDVAPDGTIYVSNNDMVDGVDQHDTVQSGLVLRVRPGAAAAEAFVPRSVGIGWITKLAVQPDGSLRLAAEEWPRVEKFPGLFIRDFRHARWAVAPDGKATKLAPDAHVPEAFDAQGRGYAGEVVGFQGPTTGDRRIRRLRPDGSAEVVAGEPGGLLGGTSLDESIGQASQLAFDAAGNLYVRDQVRRQVRRVARESM